MVRLMRVASDTTAPTSTMAAGRIWIPIAGGYAMICAICILKGLLLVPLFVALLPACGWLLRIKRWVVPLLFIASKAVLDSVPGFSYQEIAAGLTLMDFLSLLALGGMGCYLLIQRQFTFDGVTLSTLAILLANLATVVYHGNVLESVDVVSKWLFFWWSTRLCPIASMSLKPIDCFSG